MLRSITEVLDIDPFYKRLVLTLGLCGLLLLCGEACTMNAMKNSSQAGLRSRVQQFYSNWKDLNYDECVKFLEYSSIKNKEQFIHMAKKRGLRITGYQINAITITGTDAKVEMTSTVINGQVKLSDSYFDYWKFAQGDWYLTDFGRKDGMEDAVKPYEFDPNKFRGLRKSDGGS